MLRPKIGLDWDDVLAPFNDIAVAMANEKYNIDPPLTLEEVTSWNNTGRAAVIKEFYYNDKDEDDNKYKTLVAESEIIGECLDELNELLKEDQEMYDSLENSTKGYLKNMESLKMQKLLFSTLASDQPTRLKGLLVKLLKAAQMLLLKAIVTKSCFLILKHRMRLLKRQICRRADSLWDLTVV